MGGDIILDTELSITPPAKTVHNYAWQISNDGITVQLNYFDNTGTQIVKQETFYIRGDDFTPLANAVVGAGHVGQKFMDIIERSIRNKVKSMKGWNGTVS